MWMDGWACRRYLIYVKIRTSYSFFALPRLGVLISLHTLTHSRTHAWAHPLFVCAERFLSLIRALSINVSVVKFQFHTKTARNWQLPIGNSLATPTATATAAALVIVIVIMPQPQPQPQLWADVSISERRIVNQRMSLWRFRFSGKTLLWNLTKTSSLNLGCILPYYILIQMCILYLCVLI